MPKSPAERAYDRAYEARPEQVKKREERNRARAIMERKGAVHKGDGMDVDHKKMLKDGGKTTPSNLRVVTQKKNRGWERDS